MTALRTLLTGMAADSWKKLSASTDGNFDAAMLAHTRANFDAGTTWASDAAVASASMAGINNATGDNVWAFSKAAIRSTDGQLYIWGGGHTDSGDGSIFGFSVDSAATSLNSSGPGGSWTLAVPGARFLDQFTQSKPAWSFQGAGTAPTGTNQAYWAADNKDGVHMPISSHTYGLSCFDPVSGKFALSGWFGYAGVGDTNMGAAWAFDDQNTGVNDGMIGPIHFVGGGVSSPFAHDPLAGYAQLTTTGPACIAWNDLDGLPYTFGANVNNGLGRLWKITNPFNPSTVAINDIGNENTDNGQDGFTNDAVIIPDPVNGSTKRAFFMHINDTTNGTFVLWTDIGGTPAYSRNTYSTTFPTVASASSRGWTYDTSRSLILFSPGNQHIYKVTPSATLSAWTITEFTVSPTGDLPTINAGSGLSLSRLQYIPSQDCFILAQRGSVWVYKPTGWSPPAINTTINITHGSFGYTGKIEAPGTGIQLAHSALTYTGRFQTLGQIVPMHKTSFSYAGRALTPAQAVLISKGSFGYSTKPLSVAQAVALLHASLSYNGRPFTATVGTTVTVHTGSFSYTGRVLTPVQALAELRGHLSYTGKSFGVDGSLTETRSHLVYTGKPFVVSVGGNTVVAFGAAFLNYNGRVLDVPEQGGFNDVHDLVITPYVRATPPSSEPATVRYLNQQLQRIQRTMSDLTDAAEQVYAQAPANPRRGMIRYAVSPWSDTLSGEGLYIYKGPSVGWVKII